MAESAHTLVICDDQYAEGTATELERDVHLRKRRLTVSGALTLAAVLVIGMGLSLLAFLLLQNAGRDQETLRFQHASGLVISGVEEAMVRLSSEIDVLANSTALTLAALRTSSFGADPTLMPRMQRQMYDEFEAFVALNSFTFGVLAAPIVANTSVSETQAALETFLGVPRYTYNMSGGLGSDGQTQPAIPQATHAPSLFHWTLVQSAASVAMLDLFSIPIRAPIVARALAGGTAATGPVPLVGRVPSAGNNQHVMYIRVDRCTYGDPYRACHLDPTPAGLLVVTFGYDGLLTAVLDSLRLSGDVGDLCVALYAGDTSVGERNLGPGGADACTEACGTVTLPGKDVAGRICTGRATSFTATSTEGPVLVLVVGGIATVLIGALAVVVLWLQVRGVQRDAEIARAQERSLMHLISSVSHDMRTPLFTKTVGEKMLEEEVEGLRNPANETVRALWSGIQASTEMLSMLVSNALDADQMMRGDFSLQETPCHLGSVCVSADGILRPTLDDSGLELAVRPRGLLAMGASDADAERATRMGSLGLATMQQQQQQAESGAASDSNDSLLFNAPVVHVDNTRLLRCIVNLCSNSRKFTRTGHVTVTVGLHMVRVQDATAASTASSVSSASTSPQPPQPPPTTAAIDTAPNGHNLVRGIELPTLDHSALPVSAEGGSVDGRSSVDGQSSVDGDGDGDDRMAGLGRSRSRLPGLHPRSSSASPVSARGPDTGRTSAGSESDSSRLGRRGKSEQPRPALGTGTGSGLAKVDSAQRPQTAAGEVPRGRAGEAALAPIPPAHAGAVSASASSSSLPSQASRGSQETPQQRDTSVDHQRNGGSILGMGGSSHGGSSHGGSSRGGSVSGRSVGSSRSVTGSKPLSLAGPSSVRELRRAVKRAETDAAARRKAAKATKAAAAKAVEAAIAARRQATVDELPPGFKSSTWVAAPEQRVSKALPSMVLHVTVEDSGKGMDAETLAGCVKLFQHAPSAEGGGSGLGMHMVLRTTLAYGGAMTVSSAPGRGTRIDLYWAVGTAGGHGVDSESGDDGSSMGGSGSVDGDDASLAGSSVHPRSGRSGGHRGRRRGRRARNKEARSGSAQWGEDIAGGAVKRAYDSGSDGATDSSSPRTGPRVEHGPDSDSDSDSDANQPYTGATGGLVVVPVRRAAAGGRPGSGGEGSSGSAGPAAGSTRNRDQRGAGKGGASGNGQTSGSGRSNGSGVVPSTDTATANGRGGDGKRRTRKRRKRKLARRRWALAPDVVRVLVVDDHGINRKLVMRIVERTFRRESHQELVVKGAVHGAEAVSMARAGSEAGEPWHLILMDVNMPIMDGIEATRAIVRRMRSTERPVVCMLTAASNTAAEQAAVDAGARHALVKPCQPADLRALLLRARVLRLQVSASGRLPAMPRSDGARAHVARQSRGSESTAQAAVSSGGSGPKGAPASTGSTGRGGMANSPVLAQPRLTVTAATTSTAAESAVAVDRFDAASAATSRADTAEAADALAGVGAASVPGNESRIYLSGLGSAGPLGGATPPVIPAQTTTRKHRTSGSFNGTPSNALTMPAVPTRPLTPAGGSGVRKLALPSLGQQTRTVALPSLSDALENRARTATPSAADNHDSPDDAKENGAEE